MSIRIIENDQPPLSTCPMLCDVKLSDRLDNYDMLSFLNGHTTTLFIGKPKSGKTSLLYSFFKSKRVLNRVFDKIFLFQPALSRASMADKLFDRIPDDQKYETLTLENLLDAESKLGEGNNVMLFDDMTAYLKDVEISKKLRELVFNRRHKHLSIYFLTQTWYSIPRDIRKMFSNIFVFKVGKAELTAIWDEVIEYPREYIMPVLREVYDEPYKYLMINTDSQRLFSGFDEIILE